MRQCAPDMIGLIFEPYHFENTEDLVIHLSDARNVLEEGETLPLPGYDRHSDVLESGQLGKDVTPLECSDDSEICHALNGPALNLLPPVHDPAGIGPIAPYDEIEKGSLPRPIRPDNGTELPLLNGEAQLANHLKSGKILIQALYFE